MDLIAHFQNLARYNRVANHRIYEACAQLDDTEYRKPRAGSLGSIHALLNHILLGDRIWMQRFESDGPTTTPPLKTILYDDFAELRDARLREDERVEKFFASVSAPFWDRPIAYVNSLGQPYTDPAAASVAHLFNHQTHHRGQVHVMLAQTAVAPPSLDMHRILNP
jgi:uncharacterized damage-inducible protein DinB